MARNATARNSRNSNKEELMSTTTQANTPAEDTSDDTGTDSDDDSNGNTVTIEIAGLQVTLPRKFAAGHPLTENEAKVLDAAYQRQFTNNQNASAKSRAIAYGEAKTDAERAAKAPLSASEIAALYADYEPNVGGGPRMGSMERMRLDAAWRAWVKMVKEHNDAVATGAAPVIEKAGPKPVALMSAPRKTKDMSDTDHKAAKEAFEDTKNTFLAAMLAKPAYAERIQNELDAIIAERGAGKDSKAEDTLVTSDDLL